MRTLERTILTINILAVLAGATYLARRVIQVESQPVLVLEEDVTVQRSSVQWLNSPVTQSWVWEADRFAWRRVPNEKDSLRFHPAFLIGLRDDGTVVWKVVEK